MRRNRAVVGPITGRDIAVRLPSKPADQTNCQHGSPTDAMHLLPPTRSQPDHLRIGGQPTQHCQQRPKGAVRTVAAPPSPHDGDRRHGAGIRREAAGRPHNARERRATGHSRLLRSTGCEIRAYRGPAHSGGPTIRPGGRFLHNKSMPQRIATQIATHRPVRIDLYRFLRLHFPRAMALRLIRALPGEAAFLAPVVREKTPAGSARVAAPGPHDFAVRCGVFVRRERPRLTPQRPSHPVPNVS
jgi:hypothetical protein